MINDLPLVAITMGDPVGIGPELVHKALMDRSIHEMCRPVIIGDYHVLLEAGKTISSTLDIRNQLSTEECIFSHGTLNLLKTSRLNPEDWAPGSPTGKTGRAMIGYIEKAIDLTLSGTAAALVTCPINKTAMKLAESEFHGHTELLASATGTDKFLMMMYGHRLSVVLVTIHIPLSEVILNLTTERILETITITADSFKKRFGISEPVIAVAGLNPHAGEEGLFGNEETDIIQPAVKEAERMGYNVTGPVPPDTVYYNAAKGRYDVVVSMYHDQGLIPFKMIHFEDGVNTTLGLPIIRTSVDHGTAYDLAGKGLADEGSLIAAIKLASHQAVATAGFSKERK